MKWPLFRGFLGALFPQVLFSFAKIFTRGSLRPIRQTQYFKTPSDLWISAWMEGTQSLQFWSVLGPNLPLENQKYC